MSTAARTAAALRRSDAAAAADIVAGRLAELGLGDVVQVCFTSDEYSLNSVSGKVRFAAGPERFFKFHTEEGEADGVGEYYRAGLLADAGLPVDVPTACSGVPGDQMMVYDVRSEPRLVDVCRDLEKAGGASAALPEELLRARRALDRVTGRVACRTVQDPTPTSAASGIHQLFGHRLVDPDGRLGGTRFGRWYAQRPQWQTLADRHWVIDGIDYPDTLAEVVARAGRLLRPHRLAVQPVVLAHGDDHHGNIWVLGDGPTLRLSLFDPAFAATDIPWPLAAAKATFHNALAHPAWLYHPGEVDLAQIAVDDDGGTVRLQSGTPRLSPLRAAVLDSVVDGVWIPLIRAVSARGLLDDQWRSIVRSALVACPLLVTDLLDAARPEPVRLLALGRVLQLGSEPAAGHTDPVAAALDRIEEAVR